MRIAVPHLGEEVAPCFEYSATIGIFTIEDDRVTGELDFTLRSDNAFDRLRLLREEGVETLICGGVQRYFEDLLRGNGIAVISWVSGRVDELLARYLRGELVAGSARLGGDSDGDRAE